MPQYAYKATSPDGKIITGALEAVSEKSAAADLHNQGYIPIRIKPVGKGRLGLSEVRFVGWAAILTRITTRDVMLFTQDLATLIGARLPMDKALAVLIDAVENERLRRVVQSLFEDVQSGSFLSDALAKHPRVFSRFYVNMIRAGEAGGVLEAVLDRMSLFLEEAQDLKDYIKSAMVYPLFLTLVGGVSIAILLTFVIPKFAVIFADFGQAIPLSTRFLLALSGFLQSFWWAVILVILAVFYMLQRYSRTPAGRLQIDQFKMRLPVVKDLVQKIETARFARTLGTLIKSGVPILQALLLVRDIIGNQVMAGFLENIHARVKEGERLSRPLADSGQFPSLAVQMITVGEETGRLDDMLLKLGRSYEKMVRNLVKKLISLLEPAMILAMGLLVGFIVISMLMAIFSINEMPF